MLQLKESCRKVLQATAKTQHSQIHNKLIVTSGAPSAGGQVEAEEGLDAGPTRECVRLEGLHPQGRLGFRMWQGWVLPSGPGNRTFCLGCVLALGLGETGPSTCDHVLCCM